MCGITGFFARESVPDFSILDTLFTWGEKRGSDGFGIAIVNRNNRKLVHLHKWMETYSDCRDDVEEFINGSEVEVGDLILAISRAAPEQEPPSSFRNMQPIYPAGYGCILVHNGSVSHSIHQELINTLRVPQDYQWETDIDSESIIAAYSAKFGRNIKDTMEYISGGAAAIMYDTRKDCIYTINDFKPLAQAAIRGYGYILASDVGALREVIYNLTSCPRDGVCIWEDYYAHYLGGGRIKEIDLDSGFVKNIKYSPRFITQNWDSNYWPDGIKKFNEQNYRKL